MFVTFKTQTWAVLHAVQQISSLPLILAVVYLAICWSAGQVHETVLYVLKPGHLPMILFGTIAFVFLSIVIHRSYISNWISVRKSIEGYGGDYVYTSTEALKADRWALDLRDLYAAIFAMVPFLGLAVAGVCAKSVLQQNFDTLTAATRDAGLETSLMEPTLYLWRSIVFAFGAVVLAIVMGVGLWFHNRGLLTIFATRVGLFRVQRLDVASLEWATSALALPKSVVVVVIGILALPFALQQVFPDILDYLSKALGPIAVIGSTLAVTVTLLTVVGNFSRRVNWPILLSLASVVFIVGLVQWSQSKGPPDVGASHQASSMTGLKSDWNKWLNARKSDIEAFQKDGNRPYPVFIVAAQGGGIYAAAGIAALTTKLQETCPSFARHVFAVSAVSGGALGATVVHAELQAAVERHKLISEPALARFCKGASGDALKPGGHVAGVLLQDHLSAPLLVTVPEVLLKLVLMIAETIQQVFIWFGQAVIDLVGLMPEPGGQSGPVSTSSPDPAGLSDNVSCSPDIHDTRWLRFNGRAEALECSFVKAADRMLPLPRVRPYEPVCASPVGDLVFATRPVFDGQRAIERASRILSQDFETHWTSKQYPALVLNATWAETGYRVAFAPFPLGKSGDRTVTSFRELTKSSDKGRKTCVSLIGAAVTSARFPAVMPAMIVEPDGKRWWNLVDGGYADASGASTALDLYRQISEPIAAVGSAVRPPTPVSSSTDDEHGHVPYTLADGQVALIDPKLLILTDGPPGEDYSVVDGDGLLHAISPVTTLLAVRTQLARRAVQQAEVSAEKPPRPFVCHDTNWKARLIVLDQDHFSLPLGWTISEPTYRVVESLVGDPRGPRAMDMKADGEPSAARTLYRNSCTLNSIVEMLSGR
ncbi:MAG: hypothetical protein NW216_11685 [Hyphomicrobium sp.]|nr:hypothetical protein [Hyphomicrobium sp.]